MCGGVGVGANECVVAHCHPVALPRKRGMPDQDVDSPLYKKGVFGHHMAA